MPLISVIIPNYNNAQWLSLCLESCINQSGDFEKEIIVVDDQSTDESWEILKKIQKANSNEIFIYRNPEKGGNQARNFGFSRSSGDYIQWLDSDDTLLPGKFDTQLIFLENNSTVDIVYSDWRMDYFEDGIKIREELRTSRNHQSFVNTLMKDEWLPNNSYLLRRKTAELLHKNNAWNLERKVAQDREYFTMAAIYGARFSYVKGFFSVYNRWSENTVSSIDFKSRLKLNLQLEFKFIELIKEQEWMNRTMKRELISILKTHELKSCYYDPRLRILNPISFFNIKWGIIHYKMRVVIPFVWSYQMILYYFNQLRN